MNRFEVETKTQNFLAHYEVIKGQLNQVNQEINDAIELKNSYLTQVATLEGEIATKQTQLLGLRREESETQKRLEEKTNLIRDTYRQNEEEEERHLKQLAGVAQTLQTAQRRIKELEKEIDALLEKRAEQATKLEEDVEKIATKIKYAQMDLEDKRFEISHANEELIAVRNELDVVKKEIGGRWAELDEREERIKKREAELSSIASSYIEAFKVLKNRENDSLVIAARLKRKYYEIFGKEITI